MAFSLSYIGATIPYSKLPNTSTLQLNHTRSRNRSITTKCESTESVGEVGSSTRNSGLQIGSPVIVVEAPTTLKTAASVPCLKVNSGLVNPGDVGRIVASKPKDVWAVRLAIGTYLLDGKHFKPLELDE